MGKAGEMGFSGGAYDTRKSVSSDIGAGRGLAREPGIPYYGGYPLQTSKKQKILLMKKTCLSTHLFSGVKKIPFGKIRVHPC
jgi:hypothetical protein